MMYRAVGLEERMIGLHNISRENTGPTEEFVASWNISRREQEIIRLLLKGNSYSDIAKELFISFATVKTHIHNIYVKTKVSSRFALMELVRSEQVAAAPAVRLQNFLIPLPLGEGGLCQVAG